MSVPTAAPRHRNSGTSTITGSLGIAVGLAAVSYDHIYTFVEGAGAQPWEAAIIAATVDGLLMMAVGAIAHARRLAIPVPALVKITLVVGLLATTGANFHHGLAHGWQGVVVSLWVPIAAELAYQLAMWVLRTRKVQPLVVCGGAVPLSALAATLPPAVPEPAAATATADPRAPRPAATPAPRPAATVTRLADLSERKLDARGQHALKLMRADPDMTGAALAEKLKDAGFGVHPRTGQRVRAQMLKLLASEAASESEADEPGQLALSATT